MKNHIGLVSIVVASLLITAESHAEVRASSPQSKSGSLPITNAATNRPFYNTLPDGTQFAVRLDPISQQEAAVMQKQAASLLTIVMPSSSYAVTSPAPNIDSFYGKDQLQALNQKDFGTCVTFSTAAALSYLTTGLMNTGAVSPLYLLDQGYIDQDNSFDGSGWEGLADAGVLLERLLLAYQEMPRKRIPGKNEGYYPSYDDTRATYDRLSAEYAQSSEQGELTVEQLQKSGFDKQLSDYQTMADATPATLFSKVRAANLNISIGSPFNAVRVKRALDAGHLVLLDFNIFDANVPTGPECTNGNVTTMGTARYKFDSSTNVLTKDASSKESNNTWADPRNCLLGGHQVWVISYATDQVGRLMFVIRNSWGDTGDQSQYYMSEFYLNNAASYASELSLAPNDENA